MSGATTVPRARKSCRGRRENSNRYGLVDRCRETDRANAALLLDLKRRGLLDQTLVIWGGEFGRTPMNEERNGSKWLGRDHNQHAFTVWLAGGGVRRGLSYGATDDLGYHAVTDRVHVHDLQATILHLLGLDHERLTFRFQGRDFRLTDVHGHVVRPILG
jgi:arylsulfatase A-like enzyme